MASKEPQTLANVRNQYYAAFAANLIMIGQGTIIGWVAPALGKLISENTPLESGPLTSEQSSWIGSLNSLGSLIGSMAFGYCISLVGCKRTTIVLTIPSITFWLLIYFGNNYYFIRLANFCGGWLTGGSQSTIMLYISEIANNDIRGRLGSMPLFFRNIGILIAYILGATVDYKYIPCICVVIPIVFAIIFSTLSNTPQFYLGKGNLNKAEKALKHYKGYKGKTLQEETALYEEFERLKSIAKKRQTDNKLNSADFCDRESLKGLGIAITLIIFSQCTASLPFVNYAVTIFKESGTSLNPYTSSIMLASALLLGSLLTYYLADIFGRKLLNFISLAGASVGLFAMSTYQYLNVNGYDLSGLAWIPVACLSFVIFISSAGITPLSVVCSVEFIPLKIRTFGMTLTSFSLSILGFVSVKTFPNLIQLFGLHGCTLIYGIGCILGAIFVVFVQKETRGQAIDDVEKSVEEIKEKIDLNNRAIQPLISEQTK